ncbi:serine-type endopeptidase inhibitor activity protein [Halocaridina rubra]|uniref:Serine-type endopeptidase inhibitor activity protein n=1 Tax=Halocaridina rubra TaxID=373956 RepID=A0AAN8WKJ8_HALRR
MTVKWQILLVLLASTVEVYSQCFPGYNTTKEEGNSSTIDTEGITSFGLKLYKELAPGNATENFFFSPYLIWSGLTLAYFGSEGDAERELAASLNISNKGSAIDLWKTLIETYEQRQTNNTLYTLNFANRAYFDTSIKVEKCLNDTLQDTIRGLDMGNVTIAARHINSFVSQTTEGRIPQIIQPQDISGALMILVNAAFFKGTWKYQFNASTTQDREFYLNNRDVIEIPMMSLNGSFRYGVSRELSARVLELPYAGMDISMFILLPFAVEGPPAFRFSNMINSLNSNTLRRAISPRNMTLRNVHLILPKFKFTHAVGIELERALGNLNISDIFKGNLSAFAPDQSLSINKIIHQAFVEINEEGTEAAAVTISIPLSFESEPIDLQFVRFHCTEPFVFFIHDNLSQNILFMGSVKNPQG